MENPQTIVLFFVGVKSPHSLDRIESRSYETNVKIPSLTTTRFDDDSVPSPELPPFAGAAAPLLRKISIRSVTEGWSDRDGRSMT